MDSELRLGGGAGLAALFDPALWFRLVQRALSPLVLAQVAIVVVAALLAAVFSLSLPRWVPWLLVLGLAAWLAPYLLRWFVGTVASRAVHGAALEDGLSPQPLPPVSTYRRWWAAPLACALLLGPATRIAVDAPTLPLLLVAAALVWLATPAFVRSMLAPWFALERIDATLKADRPRWMVLTAFWMLAFALLHWLALQASGLDGLELPVGAPAGSSSGHMLVFAAGHVVLFLVLTAAVGIFCTAAMARMAAQRLLGTPASEAADGSPLAVELMIEAAARAVGATRGMTVVVVAALVLVLAWPHMRRPVILAALHFEPGHLQDQRNTLGCRGETQKLRLLHWAGIDAVGDDQDTALACAAVHGHLDTVRLLVGLGDSPIVPVEDDRFHTSTTRLSPIAQAMQSEQSLPAAEYLMNHAKGPTLLEPTISGPDAVQAAALSHCMACVEWAVRHHAPLAGTWQATPMALWLDSAGRGTHEVANLQHLAALGLSPTALGADGRSALHAAANNGDLDAINWLLELGANPAVADTDGNTPLLHAANRLGTGPDNRPISPGADSDRERVKVVQRLLAVTPTVEHGTPSPIRKMALAPLTPYVDWPVSWEHVTRGYAALQDGTGPTLNDLITSSPQE